MLWMGADPVHHTLSCWICRHTHTHVPTSWPCLIGRFTSRLSLVELIYLETWIPAALSAWSACDSFTRHPWSPVKSLNNYPPFFFPLQGQRIERKLSIVAEAGMTNTRTLTIDLSVRLWQAEEESFVECDNNQCSTVEEKKKEMCKQCFPRRDEQIEKTLWRWVECSTLIICNIFVFYCTALCTCVCVCVLKAGLRGMKF